MIKFCANLISKDQVSSSGPFKVFSKNLKVCKSVEALCCEASFCGLFSGMFKVVSFK